MLFSFPGLANLVYFFKGDCLQVWVSGITCHMYSQEERTRLTGEINDMYMYMGAERYFRRSLHVKNYRDRLIISSGSQEKGGVLLLEHVR